MPTDAALAREAELRRLLRARDTMDRRYRKVLDIPALARVALLSEAHFVRRFDAAFGYRSSVGTRDGQRLLPLSSDRRTGSGLAAGDEVEVDLTRDAPA